MGRWLDNGHYFIDFKRFIGYLCEEIWGGHNILDSNNFSIGIHFFKVLVQIHYSRSPSPNIFIKIRFEDIKL